MCNPYPLAIVENGGYEMRNDDAQVAVIIMFFVAVGAIAFYIIVIGAMMDDVTVIHNNLTQSNAIPLSQDRQDNLALLQLGFKALPIIAFVLTIISAIIFSMSRRYTEV